MDVAYLNTNLRNGARQRRVGVSLMVAAMLLIPMSDGVIKALSEEYPVLLLNWARFLIGGLIFVPVALIAHRSYRLSSAQVVDLSGRTILHVLAISLYFLAIASVPLADALGAYFVAPLVAVALGAFMLGEKLDCRRVVAVGLGFVGAMIVVKPLGSFDLGMVYAVGSGIVFGLFLVLTRKAATTIPPFVTLAFQCAGGAFVLLPVAIVLWTPFALKDVGAIAIAGAIWAVGHLAIIYAFKYVNASTLAPLIYLEILGGAAVGYLLFEDVPSAVTTIGISVVLIAGLVAQHNSTRKADLEG